eukprot:5702656-Ditylum_brightwellii.AAC.1
MDVIKETVQLSKHFEFSTVLKVVHKYDENSQEKDRCGNVFFDHGISSAMNQVQCKTVFGLPIPKERSINFSMSAEYNAFYNTSEDLLLQATRKLLPLKCIVKEELLYMIPPCNKLFFTIFFFIACNK